MNKQNRDFYSSENIHYETVMMGECYCTFVPNYRMYTKSEPYCKIWTLGNHDVNEDSSVLTNESLW